MSRREKDSVGSLPGCCVWPVPHQPLSVQIRLGAIDELARDVSETSPDGPGFSGLLLGRLERERGSLLVIEAHRAVPAGLRGPDLVESLRQAMRQWPPAADRRVATAGLFRAAVRERLEPEAADLELMERCFAGADAVLLLVQIDPEGAGAALFFFPKDGPRPGPALARFPLDRRRAAAGVPLPAGVETQAAVRPSKPPQQRPAIALPVPVPLPLPWMLLFATVAAAAAFWLLYGKWPPAAGNTAPPASSVLGLQAERRGGGWRIGWDRSVPAIANAVRGQLTILDGYMQRQSVLEPAELRSGSIVYYARTGDLTFRLEVFGPDGRSFSESVRLLAGLSDLGAGRNTAAPPGNITQKR